MRSPDRHVSTVTILFHIELTFNFSFGVHHALKNLYLMPKPHVTKTK